MFSAVGPIQGIQFPQKFHQIIKTLSQKVSEFIASIWAFVAGVSLAVGVAFGSMAGAVTATVLTLALVGAKKAIHHFQAAKIARPEPRPVQNARPRPLRRRRVRVHRFQPPPHDPTPHLIPAPSPKPAPAVTRLSKTLSDSEGEIPPPPPPSFEQPSPLSFVLVSRQEEGEQKEGEEGKSVEEKIRGRHRTTQSEEDTFSEISTPGSITSGEDILKVPDGSSIKTVKHYPNLWLEQFKKNPHFAKMYILQRNKEIATVGSYLYNNNRLHCNLYDPLHTGKVTKWPSPERLVDFPKCKISKSREFYQGKPTLSVASIRMDDLFQYFAESSEETPLVVAMGNRLDALEHLRDARFLGPLERICLYSTLQAALENFQLRALQEIEAIFAQVHILGPNQPEKGYPLHSPFGANFLILPPNKNLENKDELKGMIRKVLRCAFLQKPKAKKIVFSDEYIGELKNLEGMLIYQSFKAVAEEKEFQFAPEIHLILGSHYNFLKGKLSDFLPVYLQLKSSIG